MPPDEVSDAPVPDPHLTPAHEFRVSTLTAEELEEIDAALMFETTSLPRKVARVIGGAMTRLKPKYTGLPDVFFSRRVRKLIGEGKLTVEGNPESMRHCEVRRA